MARVQASARANGGIEILGPPLWVVRHRVYATRPDARAVLQCGNFDALSMWRHSLYPHRHRNRGPLSLVDDVAEVLGGAAVGGAAATGVVLDEDLGAVALAAGDGGDVEACVEQLGRGELPQGQDGAIEELIGAA